MRSSARAKNQNGISVKARRLNIVLFFGDLGRLCRPRIRREIMRVAGFTNAIERTVQLKPILGCSFRNIIRKTMPSVHQNWFIIYSKVFSRIG